MMEINGQWIGYYTYDKGYTDWNKHQEIPFRLIIQRGISEFVGRIFEEVDFGGIDDEISIKGHQNGDEIEFTKYYKLAHSINEHNETVSEESDHPNIVYYKGKFDETDNAFKGEWEIPALKEDEEGVFHENNFSGHWVIWREP
jgi:hypothetical protein